MAALDPLRRLAGRAADGWRRFSGAPVPKPFPGTGGGDALGLSPAGAMPRIAKDVEAAITKDELEALRGMIASAPGPLPTRLSTYSISALDPTKIDRILRNADLGVAIYEYADLCTQMRKRDAHLTGIDRQRRAGVANKPYMLAPSDDTDPIAIANTHLMRAAVNNVDNFPDAVYAALSKNCDGWSLTEMLWAPGTLRFRVPGPDGIGGKMVEVPGLWPRQLEWVHSKHTEFDTSRGDVPLLNVGSRGAIHLPRHKFIYMRAPGEGIAASRGYSRSVVWMHFFKHASMRDWVVFLHLYGIPFLQGKMDRKLFADEKMKAVLAEALENYGTGEERPILPDGLSIEVNDPVSISGSGEAHSKMWGVCCLEQSKAVLGVTLTTEASSGGAAYGLGVVHADAAQEVKVGDAMTTAADLRRDFHLAVLEHNAEAIARAYALAGLRATPADIPARNPLGNFRTDREWSPETRLKIFTGAADAGVEVSKAQIRHELQLDAPSSPGDTVKGKAVQVADGAAVVGGADASKGVHNEKDQAPGTDKAAGSGDTAPDVNLTPTDIATIVTVDEARASQGLPPLGGEDGGLTVAEYKARHSEVIAEAVDAEKGTGGGAPNQGKPATMRFDAGWDESKHPRANDGKFGSGSGSAKGETDQAESTGTPASGDSRSAPSQTEAPPATERSASKPKRERPFRLKAQRAPRPKQPADPNTPPKPPREYHRDHRGRFCVKPKPGAEQLTLPEKLPTVKKDGKVKPDPSKVPGAPSAKQTGASWKVRVTTDPENGYKGRSYAMKSIADGVAEFLAAPCDDPKIDGYLGQTPPGGWTNGAVIDAVTGRADQKLWDDLSIQTDRKGSRRIKDKNEAIAAAMPIAPGTRSKRDWRDFNLLLLQELHPAFAALSLPQWLHDAENDKATEEYYREQAEKYGQRADSDSESSNVDDDELPDYGGREEYQTYDHHGNIDSVPF